MRRSALLGLLVVPLFALSGCGGQLGHNSPVQVRLESTGSTVNLANLHVIVSPNNGSAVSAQAASDAQTQSWSTNSSGASFKEIDFTTTSQQIPYFVYVQNSSGVAEEVRLRILMDGNEKTNIVLTPAANTTTQEETILRNNVQ